MHHPRHRRAGTLVAAGSLVLASAAPALADASERPDRPAGATQAGQDRPGIDRARADRAHSERARSERRTGHARPDDTRARQAHDGGEQRRDAAPATGDSRARSPLGQEAAAGSPPGNNGTVKIESHGALDGIPENVPHPGCAFVVEWYGFDEGDDVRSTVTFTMQAPTADVGLTVDGTSPVFVGGDPARGAGGELGLDGRETYTLSFSGAPHPQQGYHVRLEVSTPSSLGSTTKSKVFWVEECVSEPVESPVVGAPVVESPVESPVIGLPVVGLPLQPAPPAGPTLVSPPSSILVSQPGQGPVTVVTGVATASPREVSAGQVAPTRVAAGLAGSRTAATQSLLPTALGGLAALLACLAWAVRRSAPRGPE